MPEQHENESPSTSTRQALARRYRPRRFADVAMQDHVAETLKGAVARGRVAHGYLFAGPRGVGKTTAARILAMALNCPRRGEDGEPCGECDSCQRIWAGKTSLDVVEIDAATNRGVDDARELRERAMYAPTGDDRFKVYIIDEAHMLTREAWNALLKILEEPPPRVVFVFATTEPQKIQQAAPPVLSRCQRFDFRRISTAAIVDRLRRVLEGEGIEAGDDALLPIARRAEGGMRDALSLLDQVLALADGRLSGEDVRRVLGLVGEELFVELFQILADRRPAAIFAFVERLLDDGYDLAEFYRGLTDALRALLITKLDGPGAADVREDLRDTFAELASRFETGDILRMLAQTAELDTDGRFRKSGNPRVALEILLLRFAYLDRTVELEDVVRALGGAAPEGTTVAATRDTAAGFAPAPERSVPRTVERPPAPDRAPATSSRADARRSEAAQVMSDVAVPVGPAAGASAPSGDVDAVFHAMVEAGEGVPRGLKVFLRAGRLHAEDGGRLVLELPAGPGLERLSTDANARASLQAAIAARLGQTVSLEIRGPDGAGSAAAPPQRITPEQIRLERLARLREQPGLGQVIDAWDLDLID